MAQAADTPSDAAATGGDTPTASEQEQPLQEVTVTARRLQLLGTASTASEGVVACANAPTAPGQVNGEGFGELNLIASYAFHSGWRASLGIYNVLNTDAAAAELWYVDRLQSEISAYPDGRADIHEHPLEPITARVTLVRSFDQ